MKKLYDKQIGGWYVMSIITALVATLAIVLILEEAVYSAYYAAGGWQAVRAEDPNALTIEAVTDYLPWLHLIDVVFYPFMSYTLLMAVTTVLAVWSFVYMAGTKNHRSKVGQTVWFTWLLLCLVLAYNYARRESGPEGNPLIVLIPVIAMVPAFILLRKLRQPQAPGSETIGERLGDYGVALREEMKDHCNFMRYLVVACIGCPLVYLPAGLIRWWFGSLSAGCSELSSAIATGAARFFGWLVGPTVDAYTTASYAAGWVTASYAAGWVFSLKLGFLLGAIWLIVMMVIAFFAYRAKRVPREKPE